MRPSTANTQSTAERTFSLPREGAAEPVLTAIANARGQLAERQRTREQTKDQLLKVAKRLRELGAQGTKVADIVASARDLLAVSDSQAQQHIQQAMRSLGTDGADL